MDYKWILNELEVYWKCIGSGLEVDCKWIGGRLEVDWIGSGLEVDSLKRVLFLILHVDDR